MSDTLLPVFTSHCFWTLGGCTHSESDVTPEAAHAAMERHYAEEHRGDLDRMLAPLRVRSRYAEVMAR